MSDTAFSISIAADANHDPGTWPWLRLADTGETLNGKTIYAFGVHDLGTRQPMRNAVISCTSANNTIVAAVTGKSIRVHQVLIQATASCSVSFESGAGGTALTGVMPIVAGAITAVLSGSNGSLVMPYSPAGWFQTASGALLNLKLSTSSVFGVIGYTEI